MIRTTLILVHISLVAQAQIPAPQGLSAIWNAENRTVQLSWDTLRQDIAGYHLFVQLPNRDRMLLWSKAGELYVPAYDFEVITNKGGIYKFSVAAFSNFPEVIYGSLSESITIEVPSGRLPMPASLEARLRKDNLTITWEYDNDIFDLAGFEIQLNDSIIKVSSEVRTFSTDLSEKGDYIVQLRAISTRGLYSAFSGQKLVSVK